jgi:LacI family transcriptional regulator
MATIKDVARHAGVAPSTVSRVLNNRNWVAEDVRLRVETAIQALDYRPSSVARSMRMGTTQTLGLVIRDMNNPNFAVICSAAEASAQERGRTLMVCNANRSCEKERQYLELLLQRQVDGIVLFVSDERVNNCQPLLDHGVPLVTVDSAMAVATDQLRTDGEQGGYLAVRHLLELGHRRIAVLAYTQDLLVGRARLEGCRRAFAEFGVEPEPALIRFCQPTMESAEAETEHLLEVPRPTALVTTSVQLTRGALCAISRRRLRLPDDLSFVGADETDLTRLYQPQITVIARDVPAMGSRAIEMLVDRIDGQFTGPPRLETLPFRLVPGGSTAALRQAF